MDISVQEVTFAYRTHENVGGSGEPELQERGTRDQSMAQLKDLQELILRKIIVPVGSAL